MRLETSMAMKIQVTVFWIMTPRSDVARHHHFGGPFLPPSSGWRWEDGDSMALRNTGVTTQM